MRNFRYLLKYLEYKLFSKHRHGHGIHSPFLYRFIREVLKGTDISEDFLFIESERQRMLKNLQVRFIDRLISHTAVSESVGGRENKLNPLALRFKYRRFLYRLTEFIQAFGIIEVGNFAANSTIYLSCSWANEGDYIILSVNDSDSNKTFCTLHTSHSSLKVYRGINATGRFITDNLFYKNQLIIFHEELDPIWLGEYFNILLNKISLNSVIVIMGPHRSGMNEKAWQVIQAHEQVRVTMDIFFMGLVFLRKDLQKENYVIKY